MADASATLLVQFVIVEVLLGIPVVNPCGDVSVDSAAAAELLHLRGLANELGVDVREPTPLWCDNTAAVAVSTDTGAVARSRHMARSIRSPWYALPVVQPSRIRVRRRATLRASLRISSGWTPQMAEAASGE